MIRHQSSCRRYSRVLGLRSTSLGFLLSSGTLAGSDLEPSRYLRSSNSACHCSIQSCEIASDSYTAVKQASVSLFTRGETTSIHCLARRETSPLKKLTEMFPIRSARNERSISSNILLQWRLSFMRWRIHSHSA